MEEVREMESSQRDPIWVLKGQLQAAWRSSTGGEGRSREGS